MIDTKPHKPRKHDEDDEQKKFVKWLDSKGLLFSAINPIPFRNSIPLIQKGKAMGIRSGLPDLIVAVKKEQSNMKYALTLFVEMKKAKGGQTSEKQKEWIEHFNQFNAQAAKVCNGADEAIRFITSYLC